MGKNKADSFLVLLGKFTSRRGFSFNDKKKFAAAFSLLLSVLHFANEPHVISVDMFLDHFALPLRISFHRLIEIPKILSHYIDLYRENEALRREIESLKVKSIISSSLEKENEELRKAVNFKYKSKMFENCEKVLGVEHSAFDSFILISRTHEATQECASVYSTEGLLGIVYEVFDDYAKVLPISSRRVLMQRGSSDGCWSFNRWSSNESIFQDRPVPVENFYGSCSFARSYASLRFVFVSDY